MSNGNRILLQDNTDKPESISSTQPENMSENKSENKENAAPSGQGEAWYTKPEDTGNAFGEKIQKTMEPVSNQTGPVLEKAGGVLGGALNPTVGGVMRMGKGWGEQLGVGFGNAEGGPKKQEEAEHERMKADFGGKEQNKDNPLGL